MEQSAEFNIVEFRKVAPYVKKGLIILINLWIFISIPILLHLCFNIIGIKPKYEKLCFILIFCFSFLSYLCFTIIGYNYLYKYKVIGKLVLRPNSLDINLGNVQTFDYNNLLRIKYYSEIPEYSLITKHPPPLSFHVLIIDNKNSHYNLKVLFIPNSCNLFNKRNENLASILHKIKQLNHHNYRTIRLDKLKCLVLFNEIDK